MRHARPAALVAGGFVAGVLVALALGGRSTSALPTAEESRATLEQVAVMEYRLQEHAKRLDELLGALQAREHDRVLVLARELQAHGIDGQRVEHGVGGPGW